MISVYYDLHIHTALSPCADDDMTPNDIVTMAILNGLDVIAVTDHNSFGNANAVCDAAANRKNQSEQDDITNLPINDLIVIPGIEVTTAEEVHVLCLFDSINAALGFESELSRYYSTILNREDIFGAQLLYDSSDSVTGKLERMLMAPTTVSFDRLFAMAQEYGGAFIPAHVDRGSFSVMSNLGFLPPHLDIRTVEFTARTINTEAEKHDTRLFSEKQFVFSSDSHQLHFINEKKHFLSLPRRYAKAVIEYLR